MPKLINLKQEVRMLGQGHGFGLGHPDADDFVHYYYRSLLCLGCLFSRNLAVPSVNYPFFCYIHQPGRDGT